jgi:hypothetical protein
MLDTAMAAAGAQVLVQVADRLGQPGMMGRQHGPASGRVTCRRRVKTDPLPTPES